MKSVSFIKVFVFVVYGILKHLQEKSYHPYFSDTKTHDQAFFDGVIKELLCSGWWWLNIKHFR